MKYCLSFKQNKEYLKKADEVIIPWQYKDYIFDILSLNENNIVVLFLDNEEISDDDILYIQDQYKLSDKRIKIMLSTENLYLHQYLSDIPFFTSKAIATAWEANALINLGVSSLYITGELCHQLDYIKTLPVEIRIRINNSGAPFLYEPLIGGWFRPEDVKKLDMIDVCEFTAKTKENEQALYRIYAETQEWPGPLYLIIPDIEDKAILNRLIRQDFYERRSNCGMMCQYGSHCKYCYTITEMANPNFVHKVKQNKNETTETIIEKNAERIIPISE